jgi:putative oxidoreductase
MLGLGAGAVFWTRHWKGGGTVNKYADLVGRILISAMFIISGVGKIFNYVAMQGYMESMHVPGMLLPLVILTEIGGGFAVVIGFKTRIAAFLLAGFCILSALIFHLNFADQAQSINFMKNVAIAGGFLFLVANGPGPLSMDRKWGKD